MLNYCVKRAKNILLCLRYVYLAPEHNNESLDFKPRLFGCFNSIKPPSQQRGRGGAYFWLTFVKEAFINIRLILFNNGSVVDGWTQA